MENIFDIQTAFDTKRADAPETDDLIFRLTKEEGPFLRHLGDAVQKENALLIYTGDHFDGDSWRKLGGKIAALVKQEAPASVFLDCSAADDPGALLEGLLLGAYDFDKYKEKKADKGRGSLTVDIPQSLFTEKQILCASVNMAREWGHEPADVINPQTLSERAEAFAKEYGLKCTVLDEAALREMGAGAIVAVGQGSKTPSRMILLEYAGKRDEKPVAFVGKAITFDAGGYCIKPSDSMMTMKYDKCGAMAVLGILRFAALMELETPLVGVICAAENMLSDRSYRPDDILRSLSGKTIEVKSTDAEGRLVLADGLTYVQEHYDPACMIDFATLTGGCVVALGHFRAGVMCPNDDLFGSLFASGEATHERLWRLPTDQDYGDLLKSSEADLKNGAGRWGAPITGGMFLKAFVKDEMPWAHIDIAGVADSETASEYCPVGATGFGVRLAADWLMKRG